MRALWVLMVLGASCADPGPVGIPAGADFMGCVGREKPFHLAWQDCMQKVQLTKQRDPIGRCTTYAQMLICHDPKPLLTPQELDLAFGSKAKLATCEKHLHECMVAQGCAEAKADQQELRFWKRCGVLTQDRWENCNGNETAVETFCNPEYGPVDELCTGSNAEHYARMKRDGVSGMDCKNGEVCE